MYIFIFDRDSSQQEQQEQGQSRKDSDTTILLRTLMADPYDPWQDADMESVLQYLRSNKALRVPDEWRIVLGMNK